MFAITPLCWLKSADYGSVRQRKPKSLANQTRERQNKIYCVGTVREPDSHVSGYSTVVGCTSIDQTTETQW
eukprot:863156-Amphidinium_carterae.2